MYEINRPKLVALGKKSVRKEHNLFIDSVTNQNRVMYSLRHTYATIALQIDNVEIHNHI